MKRYWYFLGFCLAAFALPLAAHAQLTQLDFDTPKSTPTPAPTSSLPQYLLGTKAPIGDAKRPPPTSTPVQVGNKAASKASAGGQTVAVEEPKQTGEEKAATGIAIVLVDAPQLGSAARSVMPREQGPFSDRDSKMQLTSASSWEKPKEKECGEPVTERGFYLKAKALKEILYRFSGTDTFYDNLNDALCAPLCASGERPWVSGFAAAPTAGGAFNIDLKADRCRYVLKRTEEHWKALEGQKVVCNCLPETFR